MHKLLLFFFTLIIPFIAMGQGSTDKQLLLIGTYTKTSSEGIYLYEFDSKNGQLQPVGVAKQVDNPSYLVVAPNGKQVYSVNEVGASRKGSVSAFTLDRKAGLLTFIGKQPAGGDGPCYINTDRQGKFVVVGNYASGSLSALPIQADGNIAAPTQTIQHTGSSIHKSRQEAPHVHCVEFSPEQRYLYVPDLGTDKVNIYKFDPAATQPLQPASPAYVDFPGGSGPRHLVFHANGKWAYVIHELDGKISVFNYQPQTGSLDRIQAITTLPAGFTGTISGADIHIAPDGKFLYASNRGTLNDIVIYRIDAQSGKLTYVDRHSSGGKTPRNFTIDPSGHFLLAANQDSDNVVVFKRDVTTGKLTATGHEIKIAMPVCLKMTSRQ